MFRNRDVHPAAAFVAFAVTAVVIVLALWMFAELSGLNWFSL